MHDRNTNGIYATEDHPYVWAAPFESRRRTLMGFICLGEYREGAVQCSWRNSICHSGSYGSITGPICESAQDNIKRDISRGREEGGALMSALGFSPIQNSGAKYSPTWKATKCRLCKKAAQASNQTRLAVS